MRFFYRLIVVSGILLVLSGCYDYREVHSFLKTHEGPVCGKEYRMYPPDIIMINSLNVPEINMIQQQIRPDGKINLPLLGEVTVSGKTAKEAEAEINKLAGKYYAEVDSTVRIVLYKSQNYFVFGHVQLGGPIPWNGRNSLLDALARAQPTELAWMERIVLVRGGKPQIGGQGDKTDTWKYYMKGIHPEDQVEGESKMIFNVFAMIKEGDLTNNILLQPNDVIYVQPHPLARIGLEIQKILFPVKSATSTLVTPVNAADTLGG